jgi:hypothetical protein
MNEQGVTLRITGKNSDGEYWLHINGSEQSAGFNLGDPSGMIASALLMAASGHTYTRLDHNTRVVTVDQLERWDTYSIDDDVSNEISAIIGEVQE